MDCIVQLLGVFANAVTVLDGDEYVTKSMIAATPVAPVRSQALYPRDVPTTHRAAAFEVFKDFGERFEEPTDLQKISAFCDPPAKQLIWKGSHTERTYRELTQDAMVAAAMAAEDTAARPAADTAGGPQSDEAGKGTGGSGVDTGRGSRAAATSQTTMQALVEVRDGRRSTKAKPNLFAEFSSRPRRRREVIARHRARRKRLKT